MDHQKNIWFLQRKASGSAQQKLVNKEISGSCPPLGQMVPGQPGAKEKLLRVPLSFALKSMKWSTILRNSAKNVFGIIIGQECLRNFWRTLGQVLRFFEVWKTPGPYGPVSSFSGPCLEDRLIPLRPQRHRICNWSPTWKKHQPETKCKMFLQCLAPGVHMFDSFSLVN